MYQKEIIYMGLHKDGSRMGSAGFLKVESRDRESSLYLKVKNIPHSINGRFPVRFYNGTDWKEVDGITLQEGNGIWEEREPESLKQVRLQIVLPGGYLIEGNSKQTQQSLYQSHKSGAVEKHRGRALQEEKAVQEETKEAIKTQENSVLGREEAGNEVGNQESVGEERLDRDFGRRGMPEERAGEENGRRGMPEERVNEENVRRGMLEKRAGEEYGKRGMPEKRAGQEYGKRGMPEERINEENVRRDMPEERAGQEYGKRGMPEERVNEENVRRGMSEEKVNEENVRRGMPKEKAGKEHENRGFAAESVEMVERIPVQKQRRCTQETMTEAPVMVSEELPQPMADKMHIDGIKEDKWEQILDTYDRIHPYGDERVYVKLEPKDFVILQAKYQHLVNNSFLLHGFYNYRYVILGKENDFYLGVPGVYYEREKMVALMFGFEAFECQSGEARPGEFGYYLRKVEL